LASGDYSNIAKRFDLIWVPTRLVDGLSLAITDSLSSLIQREGVITLVPLADRIKKRGFTIPDQMLTDVWNRFKPLEGREVPEDLLAQVDSYLRAVLSQLQSRPPVIDGKGHWYLRAEADLPPEQRI
jgi:hypothetical protein